MLFLLVICLGISLPGGNVGFEVARTFQPGNRLATATGVAITGGFFFGLLEIEIIGLLLDMLCPGGRYTLSGFRWAMSTQLVLFAIGLAGLEVNQRRLYQIMADNGVTVPTWREALARQWRGGQKAMAAKSGRGGGGERRGGRKTNGRTDGAGRARPAGPPARRAGRVKPVEAMRSTESAAGAPLTVRTIIGTIIIVAGVLAAGLAMLLDDSGTTLRASLVGIGAFLVVVGYFMAGPAFSMGIVPALGRVIGAPFGSMGRLASTNARRSPRRTAATAFALTLGMMLVTGIGMLGATMKNSIGDMLEETVTADFLATGPQDGSFPVPQAVPGALAETDGVESTVTMRMAPVQIAGQAGYNYGPGYTFTNSIDGNPQDFVDMEILEGSADLVAQPGVLVSDELAKAEGWTVGQALPLTTLETAESSDESGEPVAVEPGHETEVTITGIYSSENDIFENLLVSQSAVDEVMDGDTAPIQMIAVNTDDSVGEDEMRERLVESVKEFLVIQVKTGAEYADEASQLIDQMLSILYALLALAVIIAVLGIINTLTLGVIERRQEIGMLRAVGAYRGQIRTMIIVEAVQIALFGAIMGILAGLGLGWAFIDVLAGEGLGGAVIPWNQVLIMLGGAAVVGVVSALWPARKAAKTPPLEAIAD